MKLSKRNVTCCAYQLCYVEGGKVYPFSVTCRGDRHNWNSDTVGTLPTWKRTDVALSHRLGNLPELSALQKEWSHWFVQPTHRWILGWNFSSCCLKREDTFKSIFAYATYITKKQVQNKLNISCTCELVYFCIFCLPIIKSLCWPQDC